MLFDSVTTYVPNSVNTPHSCYAAVDRTDANIQAARTHVHGHELHFSLS